MFCTSGCDPVRKGCDETALSLFIIVIDGEICARLLGGVECCVLKGFKILVVQLGPAHLPRRDTITRFNLQYADSIIIKKIGSIPEEKAPNRK